MTCGWEGNRRSGVALATRHRHQWFSTYGLKAYIGEGDEHPPTFFLWSMVNFAFTFLKRHQRFKHTLHPISI